MVIPPFCTVVLLHFIRWTGKYKSILERQTAIACGLPEIRREVTRQAKRISTSRLHGAAGADRGLLILLGFGIAEVGNA